MIPERVLDQLRVGIVVQDPETRILYANAAAKEILYPISGSLTEKTAYDEAWQAVRQDGSPMPNEEFPVVQAIRTKGPVPDVVMGLTSPEMPSNRWLNVTAVPMLDDEGEVEQVVCSLTDITSEHTLQEELSGALRQSQSGFQAVIAAMGEGVVVHASDGSILLANRAAEDILGLTFDQMQGRHPVDPKWELTREDGSTLPPTEIPSEITRATGKPCRDVVVRVRRGGSGEIAWLSINTAPIRWTESDRPPEVVATFTDISREREALEDAREVRDRLRRATEAVPGLIVEYHISPDGVESFPFVSARSDEVMGVPSTEIVKDPTRVWEHVPTEERDRVAGTLTDAVRASETVDIEFEILHPTRGPRWVSLKSSSPIDTDDGTLTHLIAFDITERRRMTDVLLEAERQEGLGVLAAGIAHNFNNMLAAIVPTLEQLRELSDLELTDDVEDAYRAALSASELVRQLMALAGKHSPTFEEAIDLKELVQEVVRLCARTFDRRIHIETEEPDYDVVVPCQRNELQQVILNLVINARDALEETSRPRIKIGITSGEDGACITVEDNGEGMPKSVQEKLGEPFFTTKAPGFGTGLGIASARRFLHNVGGDLRWSSKVGKGSTFYVIVPHGKHAGDGAASAVVHPRTELDDLSAKVLIIDDEEMVRAAVARMIERSGLEAVKAPDGPRGLTMIDEQGDFDLVVLDLSMPEMSGFEVLDRIRSTHPELPVVIMSGYLPEEGQLEGASAKLQKPVTAQVLRQTIFETLAPTASG